MVSNRSRAEYRIQRVENLFLAAAILVGVIAIGQKWWLLFAAFLLFDLSALGYLINPRIGAIGYNLVHNYSAPAVLAMIYALLELQGITAMWLIIVAACWGFHVAVDRALGYGLKRDTFTNTHLGAIGKAQ